MSRHRLLLILLSLWACFFATPTPGAGIPWTHTFSPSNDGATPAVTVTPDRRGLAPAITDAAGTRSLVWNADGTLDLESCTAGMFAGLGLDPQRGTHPLGLRTGLDISGPTAGTWLSQSYGYDPANRLETVTQTLSGQATLSATYTRVANSDLPDVATLKRKGTTALTVDRDYDGLGRPKAWTQTAGAAVPASTGYTYNTAGQRTVALAEDGSWWDFGYDGLGQITGGIRKWSDGTPVAGQGFGYTFDDIGNRKTVTRGTRSGAWGADTVNQLAPRAVPDKVDVMGEVNPGVNVAVNAQAVTRQGNYFHAETGLAARGADGDWLSVRIAAAKPGAGANGSDAVAIEERKVWLPPTSESFAYDADGNLTGDSQLTYTWDAENRLVQVQRKAAAVAAGAPELRVSFSYDLEGRRRRIQRETRTGAGAAWQTTDERRLVWDGWRIVGELNASGAVLATYTWGLDLSGSEEGAGGIGGLLWQRRGGKDLLTLSDGHGNVTGLYDATVAQVVARYSYGPFGEPLRASGPDAAANPIRWSGKYTDSELSLVNYGYRDYRPDLGRWLTRDPLGEAGGVNLYGFVGNSPVSKLDPFGLVDWDYFWDGVYGDSSRQASRVVQGLAKIADDGGYLVSVATGMKFEPWSDYYKQLDAAPQNYNVEKVANSIVDSFIDTELNVATLGAWHLSTGLYDAYETGNWHSTQDALLDSAMIAAGLRNKQSPAQPAAAAAEATNSAGPASVANAAIEMTLAEMRQLLVNKLANRCAAESTVAETSILQKALAEAERTGGHPNQFMATLPDGTRVLFRKDFGNEAHALGGPLKGAGKIDHYNVEVQSVTGKPVENIHIVPDGKGGYVWWGKNGTVKP